MPRKSAREHRQVKGKYLTSRTYLMTPKQRKRSNKGAGGIAIIGGFKNGLPKKGVRFKK